jgi:hypothetical protein
VGAQPGQTRGGGPADLRGARFVRDRYGWHEVVRVNARTVTVRTGYSWGDRIAMHKILKR